MSMDTGEMLVAALAAAAGVLLVFIALRWRISLAEAPGLPLWRFLRREGITRDDAADNVSAKVLARAELGCAVCGGREQCRARLAASGDALPPANCPNAPLFEDFGITVGQARK